MSIFGADVPFAEHCGIREIEFLDGRTRLRLLAVPSLSNNVGALHGRPRLHSARRCHGLRRALQYR
jgi:hypothetical protein